MKTLIQKLFTLVTLTVVCISLNAQNTKEYNNHKQNQKLSHKLIAEMVNVETQLSDQSESLMADVRFSPSDLTPEIENSNVSSMESDILFASKILESQVKYQPDESIADSNSLTESTPAYLEAAEILENAVKYRPGADHMLADPADVLVELTNELSQKVKFQPSTDF